MRTRLTGSKSQGKQAVVLFTPQSRWDAMQSGFEASNYADDFNAGLAEGESGESWFAADIPQPGDQVPVWAADFYCAAKRIHDLVRFMNYPKSLNYRCLNNVATLLVVNKDYFFTASSQRCQFADRAVLAYGVDKAMPEYFVYLDAPVPSLVNIATLDAFVEETAFFDREYARADLQELMRFSPILWTAPTLDKSLEDMAKIDTQYQRSCEAIALKGDGEGKHEDKRMKLETGFRKEGATAEESWKNLTPLS
jgi:hypothetical protein